VDSARTLILGGLVLVTVAFIVLWTVLERAKKKAAASDRGLPTLFELLLGFVTNFLDTLGIGSFAPTTAVFKLRKMVPDERIPGTLNVGHTLPTLVEALIFIAAVKVEAPTLVGLILAAVLGAWIGAGIVTGLPRRTIQAGMGGALLVAAALFAMKNLELFPKGAEAFGLSGWRLGVGLAGNFVLGILMMLGIGLYAPCMILVSLLGMHPIAAFPIMMGSCAFLMPIASLRFISKDGYSQKAALGLGIGGIPGVLIAAYLVTLAAKYITAFRWAVVVVVLYTAAAMLRSALGAPEPTPPELERVPRPTP
jgi:uncharacterized membrane protein YfcA